MLHASLWSHLVDPPGAPGFLSVSPLCVRLLGTLLVFALLFKFGPRRFQVPAVELHTEGGLRRLGVRHDATIETGSSFGAAMLGAVLVVLVTWTPYALLDFFWGPYYLDAPRWGQSALPGVPHVRLGAASPWMGIALPLLSWTIACTAARHLRWLGDVLRRVVSSGDRPASARRAGAPWSAGVLFAGLNAGLLMAFTPDPLAGTAVLMLVAVYLRLHLLLTYQPHAS